MVQRSATSWTAGSSLVLLGMIFHWCGVASPQDNIEPIAQCVRRNGCVPIEDRNQAFACFLIGGAVEDWIERNQRIAWKIHLSYQASGKCRPKKREMNVRRSPGIVVIGPGIFAGTNCDEAIAAFGIRESVSATGKVR